MATPMNRRRPPRDRGQSANSDSVINVAVNAQIDSSITLPAKLVVSAVYHEQISARAMSGTSNLAARATRRKPSSRAHQPSSSAHCATSDSSASVATARATTAFEIQVPTRQKRAPSTNGRNDRNAQPNTNTAESRTCRRRKVRSASSCAASTRAPRATSRLQAAMFATLTAPRHNHQTITPVDCSAIVVG